MPAGTGCRAQDALQGPAGRQLEPVGHHAHAHAEQEQAQATDERADQGKMPGVHVCMVNRGHYVAKRMRAGPEPVPLDRTHRNVNAP